MERIAGCLVVFVLVVVLVPLAGAVPPGKKRHSPPPWAPAHGVRAKHRYRYFPEYHIYFDLDRRLYFFLEKGVWKSAPKPPRLPGVPSLPPVPGPDEFIELQLDTLRPYIYFEEHRRKYPGKRKEHKERHEKKRHEKRKH